MRIPFDAKNIEERFVQIAEIIKDRCVIKYLDDEYRILDFEFYYYNQNHQDISVHPRNSEALSWYINDFGGIDLNFESKIKRVPVQLNKKLSFKYELSDSSYFGGILIRQIQRLSDNLVLDGPLKVADLFRILDATSHKQSNPTLKIKQLTPIEFKKQTRHNLLGNHKGDITERTKAKADYNIQECFTAIDDSKRQVLENELALFYECEYRYCWVKPK